MHTTLLLQKPPACDGLGAGGELKDVTGQNTTTGSHHHAADKAAQLLTENPDRWLWMEIRKHCGSIVWSFGRYLRVKPTARNAAVMMRIVEAVCAVIEESFMR